MTESRPISRWAVAAITAVTLLLIYWLRTILLPFVVAGAIAFVAAPVIDFTRLRLRMPRWLIALALYLVFMAIAALLCFWIEKVVLPQLVNMAENAHGTVHKFLTQAAPKSPIHFDPDKTTDLIFGSIDHYRTDPGAIILILAGSSGAVMGFFLTIVLLLYFMLDGLRIRQGMFWLIPPDIRPAARRVGLKIRPVLMRYITGVILIVIYTSIVAWIGIGYFLQLPHAALLSLAIGILELIPVIGPIVSAVILALVAIANGTLALAIGLALFAFAMRLSIDQVVGPLILGKAITVHPVAIIFAFLVGGVLFGILGVILAVPAAAVIKVMLEYAYEGHAMEDERPPA